MSYAYRPSIKMAQKPHRPLGVAVIGGIGILAGIAWAVVAMLMIWTRMGQGIPLIGQGFGLFVSLLAALLVIWLYWGLLDMLRWAWWLNVALAVVAVLSFGALFGSAPELAALLAPRRPDDVVQQITLALSASIAAGLIFNLIAVFYLVSVRKAFGIGVKDQRPLWERRRL
jgi:hypothetical protein